MNLVFLFLIAQTGIEAGPAQTSCDGSVVTLWAIPENAPNNYEIQWDGAPAPGVFYVVQPTVTTDYRVVLTDLDTQAVYEDWTRVLVHPGTTDLSGDGDHTRADSLVWGATWAQPDPTPDLDPDLDQRQSILDWFYFCDFDQFPPNTPPQLSVPLTYTISGDTVLVNVSLTDQEQTPVLTVASQPQFGFVTLIGGQLRYTSDLKYTGLDTFEIYASDGFVQTPNLEVEIQVLAPDTFGDLYDDIFWPRCRACHIEAVSGGLSLSTFQSTQTGGTNGAGFIPGNPNQSPLYLRVADESMPQIPPPLSFQEIERIRLWILRGALP